jgi:hypothetical protein
MPVHFTPQWNESTLRARAPGAGNALRFRMVPRKYPCSSGHSHATLDLELMVSIIGALGSERPNSVVIPMFSKRA